MSPECRGSGSFVKCMYFIVLVFKRDATIVPGCRLSYAVEGEPLEGLLRRDAAADMSKGGLRESVRLSNRRLSIVGKVCRCYDGRGAAVRMRMPSMTEPSVDPLPDPTIMPSSTIPMVSAAAAFQRSTASSSLTSAAPSRPAPPPCTRRTSRASSDLPCRCASHASPWAAAARRSALARSLAEPNEVAAVSTRPGSRAVTSCSSQPLPSGSLNVANEP